MRFEITAYVAAQSASALVSLFAAGTAWRRRSAPGGLLFALMMSAVTVWTVFVTLEEGAVGLPSKILFAKISYLGAANVAPLFLLFSWTYRRGERNIPAPFVLFWVVPVATLALVATNELHGLVWTSVTLAPPLASNLAVYVHGSAWWVSSAYELLLGLAATVLIAGGALRAPRVFARQTTAMIGAVLVVWVGFYLYVAPGNPLPGFDLSAASFAAAGCMILWGLSRGRILTFSPVARDRLLEAMPDGLLVEDARGRLVDANPRALTLLRKDSSVLGASFGDALAGWPELAAVVIGSGESGSGIILPRDDRSFELTLHTLQSRRGDRLGRMVSLRDVTRRRRAEESSRESERDLRGLLQAAQRQAKELELLDQVRTSLAAEVDLPEIIRTVVEGIARAFGYTQVSVYLLSEGQLSLRHQVGYSHIVERIPTGRGITGRVFRTAVPVLVEDVREDPDFIGAIEGIVSEVCIPLFDQGVAAGVLNVESTGVAMGHEDLRLMTILGEHVSIALSKARLYAEARENEERYRTLVATLAEGIAIVNLGERFEFANPAAEAVFGVPPGGLVGKSLAEFLSEEEYARSAEETKRRRRGESTTYEQVIRRPNGETRQIELVATPRRGPDGEVIGTLGIFRDVTELRRLQERLEQERTLLLTLIDSLPDYVYLKDRDSRFILTNRAQALLLGARDSSELVGRTDADFVSKELADRYRAADLQVMRSGSPVVNIEEPSESPGGSSRRVLTTKVPIFDADGEVTGIVGISRDVTDLMRAEQEREKLQEQLQQSQKMEAVGRLAGGIAHDFNNILTVITGYCEMALEESRGNRALEDTLEEIKRAARRSATLISQLLAFSRRQILLPRVFDLEGLVDGMEGMLRRLLGEDVRLVNERGGPSLMVNADPGRIEQVIMNLAVNSRDAMPGGGQLTIRTDGTRLTADDLAGHPEVAPGEFVSLSVTDTGHGMDAATMRRLFEPFFTTKDVGKGTGLGLATVYGIVRQSNGHITCRSEVGIGTTFTVYLPRVRRKERDTGGAQEAKRLPFRGTERILLAEDDESVRRYVRSILESAGYAVTAAESGYAALELLGSMTDPPDLLLTDVIMPGMDGRVLAQEVIRRLPNIRVVFMSGYAEVASGVQELPDPERPLVQKPFSSEELLSSVRSVLRRPRAEADRGVDISDGP